MVTTKKITYCLTPNFQLIFDYKIIKSKCPSTVRLQRLLTWKIHNKIIFELYFSLQDNQISFIWNDHKLINGLLIDNNQQLQESDLNDNIANKLKFVELKDNNTFKLNIVNNKLNLYLNGELVGKDLTNRFDRILRDKYDNFFDLYTSEEIIIKQLRIERIENDSCIIQSMDKPRKGFSEINLPQIACDESNLNCPVEQQVVEKVYLTPEIYYQIKRCNDKNKNNNNCKKNNVINNYNNMTGKICISNPLVSLKGFTMEFIVKNLILFGLLFLFQTYLGSPDIEKTTKLYVCGVVLLIYNLLHIIFVILENIFVWACQYSNRIDDLVSDEL